MMDARAPSGVADFTEGEAQEQNYLAKGPMRGTHVANRRPADNVAVSGGRMSQ